jgi:hypothetical protein
MPELELRAVRIPHHFRARHALGPHLGRFQLRIEDVIRFQFLERAPQQQHPVIRRRHADRVGNLPQAFRLGPTRRAADQDVNRVPALERFNRFHLPRQRDEPAALVPTEVVARTPLERHHHRVRICRRQQASVGHVHGDRPRIVTAPFTNGDPHQQHFASG